MHRMCEERQSCRHYIEVQNRIFTCLEVGKMETNYPAITLYASSTNMSCFYFLQ